MYGIKQTEFAVVGSNSLPHASGIDFEALLCFIGPLLCFIRLDFGGKLYATDLFLLAIFPLVVALHFSFLRKPVISSYLVVGGLWLLEQVLTDSIRGTPYADFSRGWTKIFLTVTHFLTIALLIRSSRKRLVYSGVGLCAGGILSGFVDPGSYLGAIWKFGLALPVTLATVFTICWIPTKHRLARSAVLLVAGCTNFALDLRSLGCVCLTAAMLIVFDGGKSIPAARQFRTLAIGAMLAGLAVVYVVYGYAAKGGWLGERASQKYSDQSAGRAGILMGGRREMLASFAAIADSPVLGHGSWAKDPKYQALLSERSEELGYGEVRTLSDSEDLIPTHSHLFGAWVESGFAGAMFWAWVLWFVLNALLKASGTNRLFPLLVFLSLLLTWDILFSPYGADRRFTTTYFIYAVILLSARGVDRIASNAQVLGNQRVRRFLNHGRIPPHMPLPAADNAPLCHRK